MSPLVKFLIGVGATLAIGWLWHGPLGHGQDFIDRLQMQADAAVAATEVEGIHVEVSRRPLARIATLSGPANDLQREGLGSQKGITDYVRDIPGLATVRWADETQGRAIPLLAETLLLLVIAYLAGLGIARLFWGRKPRESYL